MICGGGWCKSNSNAWRRVSNEIYIDFEIFRPYLTIPIQSIESTI